MKICMSHVYCVENELLVISCALRHVHEYECGIVSFRHVCMMNNEK